MTEREHTDAASCWCRPEVTQVCPECEEHAKDPEDCWRCGGRGLVPKFDDDRPTITVHACPDCGRTHGCDCGANRLIETTGLPPLAWNGFVQVPDHWPCEPGGLA